MYDRAPRVLSRPYGITPPGIGPGTYSVNDKTYVETYAPFQTMSARESFLTISEGAAAAPGPGHYSPIMKSSNIKGGKSSKANRFRSQTSITPGPGAYTIESKWSDHATTKDNAKMGPIRFQRQGTAPSIPTFGLNYGYEEGDDGVLKPQEVPVHDSTLGPAYYDLPQGDTVTTLKYKGVHFGNLSSRGVLFRRHEGPAPNAYSYGKKSSCSRASISSNVPRYHEFISKNEEMKGVPGPGQYHIKSQFGEILSSIDTDHTDLSTDKAPFGSTLQRFIDEKQQSPACTSYQDPRTAFNCANRLHGLKRTPFGQSSKRFRVNRDIVNLPGPGAYNDNQATEMASQLMKNATVQGSPFGSTSVRTLPLHKKDDIYTPGPAHYQDTNQSTEKHDRFSHSFASKTKRLYSPPAIVADIPPPGSYDPYIIQGKTEGGTGFSSTSNRFAPPGDVLLKEPDANNPGPGEYEYTGTLQKTKRGDVMCFKDARFKPLKISTPGPGAYEMAKSVKDSVLLGTFNVSLGNPLSKDKKLSTPIKKPTHLIDV